MSSWGTCDTYLLMCWYLWRVNQVGLQAADSELENYLSRSEADFLFVQWVFGLSIESPIYLDNDYFIGRVCDLPEGQMILRTVGLNIGFNDPLEQALCFIGKKVSISKVLKEDNDFPPILNDNDFENIILAINLLPRKFVFPGFRTSYCMAHTPFGIFGGAGGSSVVSDLQIRKASRLEDTDAPEVNAITSHLKELSKRGKIVKPRRAIMRLAQAKAREDKSDRYLDLGIALEVSLIDELQSGGSPSQLSMTLRTRAAWIGGSDYSERKRIFDVIGKIYSFRSQVAHTGKMKKDKEFDELNFDEVCSIIRKVVLADDDIDWTKLTLAGF